MKTSVFVLLLLSLLNSFAAEKPFAGTFANDELTVKFVAAENGYTGEFTMSGQTFPLTAQESASGLRGKFKNDDGSFDFTAALNENQLTIKTDDTVYKLTRRANNPLAKKPNPLPKTELAAQNQHVVPPSGGSPKNTNAVSNANWKTYKHATGLSMTYPPDWQLNELPQGLQLVPPDAGKNERGPTEAYFVSAESAQGVQAADDPRVLAYIEDQLLQMVPFLRRVGEVEKIRASGAPGIFVTWEGTNPEGTKLQAYALSTILKSYGVSVLAIGETARVKAREKILRNIFTSFAAGAGERDQQLVGAWKFWSYKASADGKFGTERSNLMRVNADGSVIWQNRTESSGTVTGKDSLGNQTFVAGVAGQGANGDRGTWTAGNGKVYVQWQDGSTGEWSYRIAGVPGNRRLFLQDASQNKPDEWVEAGQ